MFITVAIQTYNNARMLNATLDSLRKLACSDGLDYEVLVVNNNSSDSTDKIIEKHKALLSPRLRSVFEPRQGLSVSRNRALAEARGEIVSFIDDDVEVKSGWLNAIAEAFRTYHATVVGGKSYLIFQGRPPKWISPTAKVLLSSLDLGDEPIVSTGENVVGVNLSVLREEALDLGGFNQHLGRNGKSMISGEEHEFLSRVRASGGTVAYEPKAVVGHVVPKERLHKKWFIKRSFYGGASAVKMKLLQGESPQLIFGLSHCARCFGGFIRELLFTKSTAMNLFEKQIWVLFSLGMLSESLKTKLSFK